METKCKICGKTYKTINGLGIHMKLSHNISTKEYYDTFFKKDNEDKCHKCEERTKFLGLREGYSKYCSRSCANSVAGKIVWEKHSEEIKNNLDPSIWNKKQKEEKLKRIYNIKPKSLSYEDIIFSLKKVRKFGFVMLSDIWDIEIDILYNVWNKYISHTRRNAVKIYHKKHPKNENSIFSRLFRDGKKDELREISKKGAIGFIKKYGKEKYAEMSRAVKKESRRKAGHNSYLLRNKKYLYEGEKFLSKEEIKCFSFLRSLGLTKEEINHEYQVDSCFIDFFPLGKFFWEYHPIGVYRDTETYEEYYQRRRELLDSNGYQDYKLIVTTSLKEMDVIERELKNGDDI